MSVHTMLGAVPVRTSSCSRYVPLLVMCWLLLFLFFSLSSFLLSFFLSDQDIFFWEQPLLSPPLTSPLD